MNKSISSYVLSLTAIVGLATAASATDPQLYGSWERRNFQSSNIGSIPGRGSVHFNERSVWTFRSNGTFQQMYESSASVTTPRNIGRAPSKTVYLNGTWSARNGVLTITTNGTKAVMYYNVFLHEGRQVIALRNHRQQAKASSYFYRISR